MAFVEVNPRYRELLRSQGLTTADDFLALPAVIVGGHPSRHVAEVRLGSGDDAVPTFLKREHHVPRKDRLANAWAGFGPVAKSSREARVLQAVREAGIGCPEWIAVGEDDRGRAFLLVRALPGVVDLRRFLRERLGCSAAERYRFAGRLGEALARIHEAGFDQPDLYSKHVLVHATGQAFAFLDWQRSRRRRFLGWSHRWRDLAALDATVAEGLAAPRERLACLTAYLRATLGIAVPPSFLHSAWRAIEAHSRRLLRKRRIRELAQVPLATGEQNLIWLDGEALCVTREFLATLNGRLPDWLRFGGGTLPTPEQVAPTRVALPGVAQALLSYRRTGRPLRWLWARLRGKKITSPELEQAGTLFRLQRYGVRTPRLLAVGQRTDSPWRMESFLLTEPLAETTNLVAWLQSDPAGDARTSGRRSRWEVTRASGDVLSRLHQAACYLDDRAAGDGPPLAVQWRSESGLAVVVGDPARLRRRRHASPVLAVRDLLALRRRVPAAARSRTDEMRFLLAYLGTRRLTTAAKEFVRRSILPFCR